MKTLQLKVALLIGTINHLKDDVVEVPDKRAEELIREGAASLYDGDRPIANPDHNPLADLIEPLPSADQLNQTLANYASLNDPSGYESLVRSKSRANAQRPKAAAPAEPVVPAPVEPPKVETRSEVAPVSIADALAVAKVKAQTKQGEAETASLAPPIQTAAIHTDKAE